MSTRPELRPVRLAPGTPGTPVTGVIGGRTCAGLVQPYEPENTLTHHTFPVRITETGQGRLLTARDVTVVDAPGDAGRRRQRSRRGPAHPVWAPHPGRRGVRRGAPRSVVRGVPADPRSPRCPRHLSLIHI